MVCLLKIGTSKILSACYVNNKVTNALIMPKRFLQSSHVKKKKLKLSHNSTDKLKLTIATSCKSNLKNLDKMQRTNSSFLNNSNPALTALNNFETVNFRDVKVDYLDVPIKSENDKKEYR